mgnify:CR=1 FL=1
MSDLPIFHQYLEALQEAGRLLKHSEKKKLKKRILYERQRGCCYYCGNGFAVKRMTFDHVVRRKDGGTWHITNLVLACGFCNQYRELDGAPIKTNIKLLKQHVHFIHTQSRR